MILKTVSNKHYKIGDIIYWGGIPLEVNMNPVHDGYVECSMGMHYDLSNGDLYDSCWILMEEGDEIQTFCCTCKFCQDMRHGTEDY